MTLRKRIITVLLIAGAIGGVYAVSRSGLLVHHAEETEETAEPLFAHRETLYLWYTDEALTEYLNSVAVSYNDYQQEARVIPVYTSGSEYLETINQASLQTEEVPDLYIVGNDSLEKAYLAGLASEIRLPDTVPSLDTYFPESSVHAVTYHEKQIAYPLYFETSSFLYNKTYLEDWAYAQLEAQMDEEAANAAQEALENNGPEENSSGEGESETAVPDENMVAAYVEAVS